MKIGSLQVSLLHRVAPALNATFAPKRGALVIARRTPEKKYEIELVRLSGLQSIWKNAVSRVASVMRVGDDHILLKIPPDPRSGGDLDQQTLQVRHVDDFREVSSFVESEPGHIASNRAGTELAVAHDFGGVNLWNARNGSLISTIASKGVGSVAYSHDDALLAVKEFSGALKIFEAGGSKEKALRTVDVGKEGMAAFHPLKRLVVAASKSALKVVDVDTGKVESIKLTKRESQSAIGQLSYSPDGTLLVTATLSDGVVSLWDMRKGEFIGHVTDLKGPSSRAEFDADGKLLLVASYKAVEVYSLGK